MQFLFEDERFTARALHTHSLLYLTESNFCDFSGVGLAQKI